MANELDVDLHALSEETSAGQGSAIDISSIRSAAKLSLIVTAAVGTLSVSIETSEDGSTSWRRIGAFGGIAAPGRLVSAFDMCQRYIRAVWTVGTSATFSVAGGAHTIFATRDDVAMEVPTTAISGVPNSVIADCLIKASCDAEEILATSNPTPITVWPQSIASRCASIAVWKILTYRGVMPGGSDDAFERTSKAAYAWLKDVGNGVIRPPGLTPASNLGVKVASGNPSYPDVIPTRMSDNWGDFG